MNVIYKARNKINGKEYIGFTSDFEKRKRKHLYSANYNNSECKYFHRALRKYGSKCFEWHILKENATYADETYFIQLYKTNQNGYNLTEGGRGKLGYKTSNVTKSKLSKAAYDRFSKSSGHDIETRLKISNSLRGKPTHSKGKIWVNNGQVNKMVKPDEIPYGFTIGQLSRK